MGLLEEIVQYGKNKVGDAVGGMKKNIKFTTDYKNRVSIEYLYTPDRLPNYILERVGATLGIYELVNEKRGITRQYFLEGLDAGNQFEKEVEKAAFLLNLGTDDLAIVANMMRAEATVRQQPLKSAGRRIVSHSVNKLVENTFNKKTVIGGDIADFTGLTGTREQATITADVYLYRKITALPHGVAYRVFHRAVGLPRGATALLTP